jgi:DNA-binding transcriptional MerR regulator
MITANILAKKSNVSLFTVRHYTRIGLLKPSRNTSNGYKIYQPSDTTRLRLIVAAKALGFTLHEIAEILDEAVRGNSPCPLVREIIERRIEENRRKIEELKKLQKKMENALKDWKQMDNSMPNGDSVCHLIESVAEVAKTA